MQPDEDRLFNGETDDDSEITNEDAATAISSNNGGNVVPTETETTTQTALKQPNSIFILEPAIFFLFVALSLAGAPSTNQTMYQICTAILKYNASDCDGLLGVDTANKTSQDIVNEVQSYAAKISMVRSLPDSIIPTLFSLFIGPWSDKFGRRPVLLTTTAAFFLNFCTTTFLFAISKSTLLNPWLYLLSSVPTMLCGSFCTLMTVALAHNTDVTGGKARVKRMFFIETSMGIGLAVGSFTCGYLYAATSIVTVLLTSTVLVFLSFLYIYFFMCEGVNFQHKSAVESKIREFFRFELVKGLVKTCFEKRPRYDRAIIWLTLVASTAAVFASQGDSTVTYYYFTKQFGITVKDYSFFLTTSIISQILGGFTAMILFRKIFKFSIVSIILIAFGCCVLESTVRATAVYWWEIYFGMALGFMRSISGPMLRAILSHVTPANQVGNIFTLSTILETLLPMGATALYALVYSATLAFNPGAFNFISASLYLLCYMFISVIFGIQTKLGIAVGTFETS